MGSRGIPPADADVRGGIRGAVSEDVSGDVPGTFAADLAQCVDARADPRIGRVAARLRRPVRVSVRGRAGVGVRTVGAALLAHGVPVVAGPGGDVLVVVVNDAIRDDERAALVGHPHPLVVLAKADLCGARPDGPMAGARRLAASIAADAGVPTVPVAALLADVALTDADVAALRTLATHGADLGSVDAFVAGAHPASRAARERLLARLDRFGIAHAVTALQRGESPSALPAILREAAGVDGLLHAVRGRITAARYARVSDAVTELRCLTIDSSDLRDLSIFASMSAAVDVVEADGLLVDRAGDAPAHLRRALHWRRYGRGPASPLHRACSADIVRGSMRLLDDAR